MKLYLNATDKVGAIINRPYRGKVDFAVVLSFFGGIGECRPTKSGVRM